MPYATSAPAATATGGSTSPPVCQNCTTSTTPLWRRDEYGSVLCNACGLFLKLHGRPRPISLKTDVIKSRNRVKTAPHGQRKRPVHYDPNAPPGLHSHPGQLTPPPSALHGTSQQPGQSQAIRHSLPPSEHSHSPVSRTGTPAFTLHHPHHPQAPHHHHQQHQQHQHQHHHQHQHQHHPSMTSQQIFDSSTYDPSNPSAALHLGHPSPSSSQALINTPLDPPPPYETLLATSNALKTRVAELEIINDLFKGRVAELEASEKEARRSEAAARDAEEGILREFEVYKARDRGFKKRSDDDDVAGEETVEDSRKKRMRLSDIVEDSHPSTSSSSIH